MKKRKIFFLGESFRPDAITWMNGLKEFGNFEVFSWELKTPNHTKINRILRTIEFLFALIKIKRIIAREKPDMVIAERTTSYGFLAVLSGVKPVAIAQQGQTDLWPKDSFTLPLKKIIQHYAFKNADIIHAWGLVMTISMKKANVDMSKVLVLPKGINLNNFTNHNISDTNKICAIVTRSLSPEYGHKTILKAFHILHQQGVDFKLTIVGDGTQISTLKQLAKDLSIEHKVIFTGRVLNSELPQLLQESNIYISMPITEGVSSSLFEAMACSCYPIVTDISGNRCWIKHQENGNLVQIDNFKSLADEIMWSFTNKNHRKQAVINNRAFVEANANYKTNMKIISAKYHEMIEANRA
ncbi:glycosyltransferase involved in cell wall biosynthesis [Flavobacterium sp. PL11]|jgi:glycosyltransferase involved in cell wall biosynthesis|uniref:glycosyltransferase n=1 Tax=Flavobacterium sp. PL11 TaxID=3071717 RepID=UPI002E05071C|nr:glycosyltransferase involved in cell wall biosynthesis [Flavobacterium sp. PL11]